MTSALHIPLRPSQEEASMSCLDILLCGLVVIKIYIDVAVSYMAPVKSLISEPPASCLLEVSKLLDEEDDLGDDWRRLWSELLHRPLNEDVVRKKSVSPTLYVLKRWCMMKPSSEATITRLMTALNSIYRNDVACVLEAYCQVRQTRPF